MICLFQHGGPSQMDLFDPKPVLSRAPRQALSGLARDPLRQASGEAARLAVSIPAAAAVRESCSASLLPHISGIADDLTLVRSMTTESVDHEAALRLIHTGKILAGTADLGLVGCLCAREREPELARLRGLVRPRRSAGRWSSQLVKRLAARDRSGNSVSIGADAGAQPQDAGRASRPRLASASFGF